MQTKSGRSKISVVLITLLFEAAALSTPAFWAIWVPLHLESDELPEPTLAWGLSSEDVNAAYAELFQSHWDSGVWPYVRLALPGSRYIEVEYATGVEFQTRVWVGFDRTPRVRYR